MDQLGKRLIDEGIITEQQLVMALERQKLQGGRVGHNLVALGCISEHALEEFFKRHPPAPATIEETGVGSNLLADLVMKHIVFMGEFNFSDLPEPELMRSIRLFGEKVIPALRGYEPF